MDFDLSTLSAHERYKLFVSLVVPRPIALVTSVSGNGAINAAPFSFFNALGSDPPVVGLGVGNRVSGEPKDTARNIAESGEFAVNLVDEAMAAAMNICAIDLPFGQNELNAAGLTAVPSAQIQAPYIAQSPASLECKLRETVQIGNNRILLGEVVRIHLRDDLFDPELFRVHTHKLGLIGRMHGGGWYARTTDLFDMPRWASLADAMASDNDER